MKTNNRFKLAFTILSLSGVLAAQDPDMLYMSGHTWYNTRQAGLAGAGVALPENVTSAYLNPALTNTYARAMGVQGLLASVGYGRGDYFTDHIVPVGVAYTGSSLGTVGAVGRYLKSSGARKESDGLLFFSGRLFEQNTAQSTVDIGVNVRYEKLDWQTTDFPVLKSFHAPLVYGGYPDTTRMRILDTVNGGPGRWKEERVLLDIGFFQAGIADHLDFGITVHDLIGYIWQDENPSTIPFVDDSVERQISVSYNDTIRTDTAVTRKLSYGPRKADGWAPGWYRDVLAGITYRANVADGNLDITIPFDVEVLGLFDRSRDMLFILRAGLEFTLKSSYILRFGYAREPRFIARDEAKPKSDNIFTGGAGLRVANFGADGYVGRNAWGMSLSWMY